jgi:hypothetical protein
MSGMFPGDKHLQREIRPLKIPTGAIRRIFTLSGIFVLQPFGYGGQFLTLHPAQESIASNPLEVLR